MAVARIKKLELIATGEEKEQLLASLQKFAKIQLITPAAGPGLVSEPAAAADNRLGELSEAIAFLAAYAPKANFLESMANLKPFIHDREMKEALADFPWPEKLAQLEQLRLQLKDCAQEKERLAQKKILLAPWRKLAVPLADLRQAGTNCDSILGYMPARDFKQMQSRNPENESDFFYEVIQQTPGTTYLAVIYLKTRLADLETLLKEYHFNSVNLGLETAAVADLLLSADKTIEKLIEKEAQLTAAVTILSGDLFKLKMVHDHLASGQIINEAGQALLQGKFTFSLSAWIRQSDIPDLEKAILTQGHEVALFYSDPEAGADVPVVLQNLKLVQPFEFITQIYGMPKYDEIDPTPFLAPFFFIYFGFCVSDAGYGLLLVISSLFALKKYQLGPTGTRFWKMFLYCGLSTITVGILTGSWFGDLPDLLAASSRAFIPLKRFKDALIILNPMREPSKLLAIALTFGIIQTWFGTLTAAWGNFRNRRYLNIFLDQVTTLLFLFGLTGLALIFLQSIPGTAATVFKFAAGLGALSLIATQGRGEKGGGGKFFFGLFACYNALSGYLSDILSYSRLWALGLVTGVMAMTINLIAVNFSQIVPAMLPLAGKIPLLKFVIGILVLTSVFIIGHLISFLMNLLGAFVHPLRLQFVEFFSKFFQSGGSRFQPFKSAGKYFNIK
jgi:V/A-type H+-transporting ATPase subunit I